MILGLDAGSTEASVAVHGIRGEDGRFHILSADPIQLVSEAYVNDMKVEIANALAVPAYLMRAEPFSSAERLGAIFELQREAERHAEDAMRYGLRAWVERVEEEGLTSLRMNLDTSHFSAGMLLAGNAIRRLRHKVELMRLEKLERRWPGAGRRMIEARCFRAYHHRRHSWREAWIKAAADYAEACSLHLELTGLPYAPDRHDPCEAPF